MAEPDIERENPEGDPEGDWTFLGKLGMALGLIAFFGAGFYQIYLWFTSMVSWLGVFGGIVAVVLAPLGGAVFPFIYWIVEQVFPWLYFLAWVIGWMGIAIVYVSTPDST